jgi:hypothetical protein
VVVSRGYGVLLPDACSYGNLAEQFARQDRSAIGERGAARRIPGSENRLENPKR